jgi:hypothetical protein
METIVLVILGANASDIAEQCNALVGNSPHGYPDYAVDKVLSLALVTPNTALVVVQVSELRPILVVVQVSELRPMSQ